MKFERDKMDRKYNKKQQEAIKNTEGPVLIIAGPGTGKTSTLIARVEHLICTGKAKASEITLTTFTGKAEEEIRSRLAQSSAIKEYLANGDIGAIGEVRVGNFHKLALELIEKYYDKAGLLPGYRVVSETEIGRLVTKYWYALSGFKNARLYRGPREEKYKNEGLACGSDLRKAMKLLFPSASIIELEEKNYWKKEYVRLMDRIREGFSDPNAAKNPNEKEAVYAASKLLDRYRKMLSFHNILDYSEILYKALNLLNDPEILKEEQKKARYLMVDEYQDTNPIQEMIISKISSASTNICAVGDDDQSLYRFRGASVENLLNFEKRYEGSRLIRLETNYRSGYEIGKIASEYINAPYGDERDIEIEKRRYNKELKAVETSGTGAVFKFLEKDPDKWSSKIIELIKKLHQKGLPYCNIAILANSVKAYNPAITHLKRAIKNENIPIITDNSSTIIGNKMVNYLLGHVFSLLCQGVKEEKIPAKVKNIINNLPIKETQEREEKIFKCLNMLKNGGSISTLRLFQYFFSMPEMKKVLNVEKPGGPSIRQEEEIKVIANFLQILEEQEMGRKAENITYENRIKKANELYKSLAIFDEWGIQSSEIPDEDGRDAIRIMSIHSSKGLEFPVVILEEARNSGYYSKRRQGIDLLPRSGLMGEDFSDRLKDELDRLRQYYTAMTRAKVVLILTATSLSSGRWKRPIEDSFIRLNRRIKNLNIDEALEVLRSSDGKPDKQLKNYSYTKDIALYESCSLAYYFLRKMGMVTESIKSQIMGSILHESLFEINMKAINAKLTNDENCIPKMEYVEEILDKRVKGYSKKCGEIAENEIEDMRKKLENFVEREKDRLLKKVDQAEIAINVSMDKYLFNGNIDFMTENEGIIDFKLSLPVGEATDDRYKKQLMAYRLLLNRKIGKEEYAKGEVNALYDLSAEKGSEALKTFDDICQDELKDWKAEMDLTVEKIEAGIFKRLPQKAKQCRTCPMKFFCFEN